MKPQKSKILQICIRVYLWSNLNNKIFMSVNQKFFIMMVIVGIIDEESVINRKEIAAFPIWFRIWEIN